MCSNWSAFIGMASVPSFSDLLQQAERLTADIDHGQELPRVNRNLHQIAEAGQRLLNKTKGIADESTDVKASILLGSRGFDLPKLSQKLETLNAAKTFEPIEPIWDTDIEGFLRNERENTLLAIIEETRKNTFEEAKKHCEESMRREWDEEKQRILDSLVGADEELEIPAERQVMHIGPLSMQGRSVLDAVEMAYAREVYLHNEAVIQGKQHSLVEAFCNVSKRFQDTNISDCWLLIRALTEIPELPVKPVEYRSDVKLQKQLVQRALMHLERSYLNYITKTVHDNPQQSQTGGIPSTLNLVKGYLRLRLTNFRSTFEDGTVDGQPLWAIVYYCLRCGDLQAAIEAIGSVQSSCGDFVGCLQEYQTNEDRQLTPNTLSRLQTTYKRSVRSSDDPFKKVVYCVVGRCNLQDDHRKVIVKTEDYMWLKLSQLYFDQDIGVSSGKMLSDTLTLFQLQKMLLEEYGEAHFNAAQNPHLFFQVLLLSQQFESAIEFLFRNERLRCHAVHFAIALHDLELLNITQSILPHSIIHHDGPGKLRQLNFARIVRAYVSKFTLTDPREAVQYYYLLHGITGANNRDLFISSISDLVLESREFEMLLGRMESDGSRRPGCVDKFGIDMSDIFSEIAKDTEKQGCLEDAVHLHDLAKNHEKALQLLSQLLSQVVSASNSPQTKRSHLWTLASTLIERYRTTGTNASQNTCYTFSLLLDLMQFFDYYHAGQLEVALDVITQLNLLPLDDETVDQKLASFRNYDDEIRRNFPDIFLATMSILHSHYSNLSLRAANIRPASGGDDGGISSHKTRLQQKARRLIAFAGMIPYRMPGDTNARLVQMEAMMN